MGSAESSESVPNGPKGVYPEGPGTLPGRMAVENQLFVQRKMVIQGGNLSTSMIVPGSASTSVSESGSGVSERASGDRFGCCCWTALLRSLSTHSIPMGGIAQGGLGRAQPKSELGFSLGPSLDSRVDNGLIYPLVSFRKDDANVLAQCTKTRVSNAVKC